MWVDLYLFSCILGTGAIPGNQAQIPQIMGLNMQKFIQTKIHKCLTPHFTSIETLLKWKTQLRVEFHLF